MPPQARPDLMVGVILLRVIWALLMPHRPHTGSRAATVGHLLSPFESSGSSATNPQIAGIYKQQKLREALRSGTPPNWQLRSQRSCAQRDRRGTARAALAHKRNRRHSCNADGMPCTAGTQGGTA